MSSDTEDPARRQTTETVSTTTSEDLDAFPGQYSRSRRFTVGSPRTVTLIDGGRRVLFLRSKTGDDPNLCLWSLEVDTGTELLLVDPRNLGGDGADLPAAERARRERARESGSGIVSYRFSAPRRAVCFALAGSLFVADVDGGPVTTPSVEGSVFDPRFSPDGTMVAYVSGSDLRVVHLDRDEDRAVMRAASEGIGYGRAEFIAAEEMRRSRGYWWSPDSTRLLVTRVDENPIDQWWIGDPAHPSVQPVPLRYPAAGTLNAQVELFLVDVPFGPTDTEPRRIAWDDGSSYEYLAKVVWTAPGPPLVVRQTRDQKEVSIVEIDVDGDTPSINHRHRINDDLWVDLFASSPTPSPAGLLTIEDIGGDPVDMLRPASVEATGPGHRALMLDGSPITPDDLVVRSIESVLGDAVVISAWTVPSEIHLFLVPLPSDADLGGPRPLIALTTHPGVHGAEAIIATDADEAPSSGSGPGLRPGGGDGPGRGVIVLSSARPDLATPVLTVHGITADAGLEPARAELADVSVRPGLEARPLFHPLGADRLESAVFFPADHDGEQPLPVILDPYGGPGAQRALKTYRPHLVSQWFADHGFVVIVTDGRGTPGRNPRWERQIHGDVAEPVLEDQIAALDAAAAEFEILDLSRVGIRGWSFGGYLAALAVMRRPDRFHAAVAGAPVVDWRLYDTHYTERYLGHPETDPLNYQRTNLLSDAARLKRPLMLIHGLADDNVVAAHTLRLSTALLSAGRPHRVLPLSGVTHMTPQEAVAENLLRLQLSFLREMLQDKPMMASSETPDDPLVTSQPSGQLTDGPSIQRQMR